MNNYNVYWIHDAEEKDILTEGYVGVTNDFERRMGEHGDKYGDIKELIQTNMTRDEAQAKEKELRPNWYIGKNIAIGGQDGNRPFGIHTSGWKHSEESKAARSKAVTGTKNPRYGKKLTDEHKKAMAEGTRKALKGVPKWYKTVTPVLNGADNPRSNGCTIDGVHYVSVSEAMKSTGVHRTTIAHRCKSDKFPNYTRDKAINSFTKWNK